jgi:hypothetical protein
MADFVNVPLGYNIPSQIPLDVKTYVNDEDSLKDLGAGNYKAFTYVKGLIIYCALEKTRYEWTEVTSENNGSGLLDTNFQYPASHSAFNINYSNAFYNFFPVIYNNSSSGSNQDLQSVIENKGEANFSNSGGQQKIRIFDYDGDKDGTFLLETYLPDIGNSIFEIQPSQINLNQQTENAGEIGRYCELNFILGKLYLVEGTEGNNRTEISFEEPTAPVSLKFPAKPEGIYTLATTDDIPSTSNFVDLINPQTITGQKTFLMDSSGNGGIQINNASTSANSFYLTNSSTGIGIWAGNLSTGIGFYLQNQSTGTGFRLNNQGGGNGLLLNNLSSGNGLVIAASGTTTGFLYVGQNNGTNTFTIDKLGNIISNSFTKSGGTSTQRLMADGSVQESNPQRVITASTTLSNTDNGQIIFINNGTTPITITINTTVTTANFGVGFIQEGTGDVTFVGSGVSLTNPIGLKSKGQGYATYIERKLNTSNFFLLGDTKA